MDSVAIQQLFAPLVGFVVAVVATIGSVLTAVFGPFKPLRLPAEAVPGTTRAFLNVVLFAPFLLCFFAVNVSWAWVALVLSAADMVVAFVAYQAYGKLLALHRHDWPREKRKFGKVRIRHETIIGGTEFTPAAESAIKKEKVTEDMLLKRWDYDANQVWTLASRVPVQIEVERRYYAFMLCSLLTVVLASLASETLVSGVSPLDSAKKVWLNLSVPDPGAPTVVEAVKRPNGTLAVTLTFDPVKEHGSAKLRVEFSETKDFKVVEDTYSRPIKWDLGRAIFPTSSSFEGSDKIYIRLVSYSTLVSKIGPPIELNVTPRPN